MISEQKLKLLLGQPTERGDTWVKWRVKGHVTSFDITLNDRGLFNVMLVCGTHKLIQRTDDLQVLLRLLTALGCELRSVNNV